MEMGEHDGRQLERYKALHEKSGAFSEGLAGYLTIAGALILLSALFFGGGDESPQFLTGVGACCFIGGGIYWINGRETQKRAWQEIRSIEDHFKRKGLGVLSNGTVYPLSGTPARRQSSSEM